MTLLGELGELGEPRGSLGWNRRTPQPGGGAVFPIGRRLVGTEAKALPTEHPEIAFHPESISAELDGAPRAHSGASGRGATAAPHARLTRANPSSLKNSSRAGSDLPAAGKLRRAVSHSAEIRNSLIFRAVPNGEQSGTGICPGGAA